MSETKKITLKKIIIFSAIPILISGIAYFYISNKADNSFDGTGISGYVLGNGIEPGLTEEEIRALLQKQVDESKIAFSINSEPVFNGKKGNIVFANPRYSAHNIDLSVKLNGKEIIKTAKISPDQYIEEISLLGKPLKKGKHNAIATIKAYDKTTDEVVGEVAIEMIITSK